MTGCWSFETNGKYFEIEDKPWNWILISTYKGASLYFFLVCMEFISRFLCTSNFLDLQRNMSVKVLKKPKFLNFFILYFQCGKKKFELFLFVSF